MNIDALGDEQLVVRDFGTTRMLVLNNPRKRNALTKPMRQGLAEQVRLTNTDDAISAIVIVGAADTFCSGLDTSEITPGGGIAVRPHPGDALRGSVKPIIAAVDGMCITGGLEVALASSFIIATDRARFADTHLKAGVFPGWGMTAMLPRAVGIRRARQLSLTGEFIDAGTALTWGLVNEVVAPSDLLTRAFEIAGLIAVGDQATKQQLLDLYARSEGETLERALEEESAASEVFRSRQKAAE